MADKNQRSFLASVKGKIIIAAILACSALLLAAGISNNAFKKILGAVDNISAPNDKLRLITELSHRVTRLDQLQRSQPLHNPAKYYGLFKESKKLSFIIDTLKTLYSGNKVQLKRIRSLKKLLADRDRLLVNYLKVREGLVNNKSFSNHVDLLNRLFKKSVNENDSTVTTTVKKTSTITVLPIDTKDAHPGFFSRLFKKKKPAAENKPYQIVNEELNVKHDTLAKAAKDSIIHDVGETMHKMEAAQLRQGTLFVNREAVLADADNKLIHQILTVLKQVEAEAVAQIELNSRNARNVVSTGVNRIGLIMLAFFVITIVLLYFILTDIARSNRNKKELEAAKDEAVYHGQAKQRFLSNMSHEIRTPLQSIIGYAELIKQQPQPDQKHIDAIYHSSGHLMQIVNEVLDYNRIISGKFTFTAQVFNLAGLLDEVVSVMRMQAEKKGITMITNYYIPGTGYVKGDAFRLKQVLYNLLGNAIKFTAVGQVQLSVTGNDTGQQHHFLFKVTDTGAGLSEHDIKRIFNEFEQAGNQPQNHLAGAGLGLTITRALVEEQGGSINVKSSPAGGSQFAFNLTYQSAPKPVERFETQMAISIRPQNGKVWIVDDDNFILDLCSSIFRKNKIPHKCFQSADEILAVTWDNEVNYILMDIRMPAMDGFELCNLLRNKIPAGVMICALTAQVMPGERELFLTRGFDGLLMKPFKEQDLLTLLNRTPQSAVKPIELDISKVEKMTFGDKNQLTKVLERFNEECTNDIKSLKFELAQYGYEKAALLMHRLAGRTAQIGARAVAEKLRVAEITLRENNKMDDGYITQILSITKQIELLIGRIKSDYLYRGAVI